MTIAKDSSLRRRLPLRERVQTEGDPFVLQVNFTGTAVSGVTGTIGMPSRTKSFYVEHLIISANKLLDIQISLTNRPAYANITQVYRPVIGPGVPVVIPVHTLFRQAWTDSNGLIGDVNVRTVLDATPTGAQINVSLTGWSIYDDINWEAEKVILWVGDSITNGTAGITTKTTSYDWQVREFYRKAGNDVRLINKSISGTTSVQQESLRALGHLEFPQADLICYSMGANDASNGVAAATYQANAAAAIAWKQARYPNAKMIVFGSTPHENNTNETTAVAIRTAGQAAVTAASDPRVKFLSLGGAFDRTNTANFATTDPAGSHIHPNDSGHNQVFAVIQPFLTANFPTL